MKSARNYLLELISEGEHQQQDFKYRVADAIKLARSVSAFANTDGGRLLIGVRDDGVLAGVRSEEEIYMMHQAAFRYCRPEASIKFDTYHVEGRTIVVTTVPRSEHRPVKATDENGRTRAYIRIKDENIVASPVHLRIWHDEQALLGASFTYGEDERRLIGAMNSAAPHQTDSPCTALTPPTLNQIVRRSGLSRERCIMLLARLIRYGLAEWQLSDHQFIFRLVQ